MRTFKIIVITVLLLVLSGLALFGIKALLPNAFGPQIGENYSEDHPEENLNDLYSKTIKQYEGVIKPLGVSIYMEGTHRLESNDQLVALLESEKVNLPDFEGKEVKVTGTVRDTVEGAQTIMDVQFIEQLKESGVTAFNEAGYEFSFSYPADWEIKKEKDKVTFLREKNETKENLMIVYQYPDVEENLQAWLKDRDQNLLFEETQVKVGDLTGVRRTITNGDEEIIKTYTKAGDMVYELRLLSSDEVIRNAYFSIVDFFKTEFVDLETENKEEATKDSGEDSSEGLEDEDEEPADEVTEPLDDDASEPEIKNQEQAEGDESFSDNEPLAEEEVQRVLEKGFAAFEGRTLIFDYPRVWYFSYLEGSGYGFTDDTTYKASNEEVTEANSRVLLYAGDQDLQCSYKKTKDAGSTSYTVCARETGLEEIVNRIAESIAKPSES